MKYKKEILSGLITSICALAIFYFSGLKYGTDDEFIIFRYVDNIARGYGFVYNVGERILGSTTPLFTLICAFFKYLFSATETYTIISCLNIVFLSVSGSFFYRLARNFLSENLSLVGVLVFALSLSKSIPEGMESPLFILVILAFLDFLIRKKYLASAVFLSLAVLTRPDALLLALIAFIYWQRHAGWDRAIRLSVLSVLVVLPWILFASFYFGSFIPQTIIAKLHTHDIVNIPNIQGFKAQLGDMSKLFWGRIFNLNHLLLETVINLLPFLALVYFGIRKRINEDNWIIFAAPAIYFLAFGLSNPIMFPWYLTQLEPLWILASLSGWAVVFEKIKNSKLKILVIILVLAGPLYFWLGKLAISDPGKEISAIELGVYIKEHKKPNDTVGLINIGAIGYYSEANIIDFFGIINDYSTAFYPVKSDCLDKTRMYSAPPNLLIFTEPDWIVLSAKEELPLCFYESSWFKKHYTNVVINGKKSDFVLRKKI